MLTNDDLINEEKQTLTELKVQLFSKNERLLIRPAVRYVLNKCGTCPALERYSTR